VAGGASFERGHQVERKFGAVGSQATWCRYTPDRRSAILRETFNLGVNTKSLATLVFGHTGDKTTLLSTGLSSGVGTKYTDRLGVLDTPRTKRHCFLAGLSSGVGTKCEEIRTSCLSV